MTTKDNQIISRNTPWKCPNCKRINMRTFLVCLDCKYSRRKLLDNYKLLASVKVIIKNEKRITAQSKERLDSMKMALESAINEEENTQ